MDGNINQVMSNGAISSIACIVAITGLAVIIFLPYIVQNKNGKLFLVSSDCSAEFFVVNLTRLYSFIIQPHAMMSVVCVFAFFWTER